MQDYSGNTKRIAKNTLMLYGRMLFSMLVSLYTSRVVLSTLGVEDFGVYNVVGGVVSMLDFLNASMSGATSRFMTFELGRGDIIRQRDTFASAMIIHLGIAFVVLLFSETFGLWFLENKLVIPESRMSAARVVYQLSILSALLSITQVPYNACLTSHERFDIFAYFSILNISLRLLIVYLLKIGSYDKLMQYSVLSTGVSILMICVYRIYCARHFQESHFKFVFRRDILKPMLGFSGWDMFGNLSVMVRTTGVNMLMNMFFGPLYNAAVGVATQVQGAISNLATNIVIASRPQIIKQFASNNLESMFDIVTMMTKLAFLLLAIFTIPIIGEIDFILKLWLGDSVPEYAGVFCVYTLLFNFFSNMSMLLGAVIHATGNIKRISLINGLLYISVLPVTYVAFIHDLPSFFPFLYNVIAVVLGTVSNAWTIKLYISSFSFGKYLSNVLLKSVIILGIGLVISKCLFTNITLDWWRFIVKTGVSTIYLCIMWYTVLLSKQQRNEVTSYILRKLKSLHHSV